MLRKEVKIMTAWEPYIQTSLTGYIAFSERYPHIFLISRFFFRSFVSILRMEGGLFTHIFGSIITQPSHLGKNVAF